jgi:NADP-dependent 3-hydroxy acid dehydrogenase YdfG
VYATVSSEEECSIVGSLCIPRDHILSDSDEEIAAGTKRLTRGKGFDVILNHSMTGEAFRHLWLLTAPFGVFIDASRMNVSNNTALDIAPFQRGSSFSVVNMDLLLRSDHSLIAEISEGAASLLTRSAIHSVTSKTVFAANTIVKAFESLQRHGHVGKTVVSFNHRDQVPILPSARNPIILNKRSTYIIAGGLGGLGQSLARLLVRNGANNLVFLSRSGARSVDAQKLMENLAATHVVAKSYECDISDENALKGVLQQCSEEMPPIKGIIQSAAVLNDSVYENMTHEMWQGTIRPKIHGTQLLHNLLPKDMDFFVMLSSISGVVGNRSQANYAAGNTFQDALARHRRQQGLPAVSIDLGLMLDIGLIAQRGGSTNLKNSEAVGCMRTISMRL